MNIEDLEEIFKSEHWMNDDISIINTILKKTAEYFDNNSFKEEIKKFAIIERNKKLFKWIYCTNEH